MSRKQSSPDRPCRSPSDHKNSPSCTTAAEIPGALLAAMNLEMPFSIFACLSAGSFPVWPSHCATCGQQVRAKEHGHCLDLRSSLMTRSAIIAVCFLTHLSLRPSLNMTRAFVLHAGPRHQHAPCLMVPQHDDLLGITSSARNGPVAVLPTSPDLRRPRPGFPQPRPIFGNNGRSEPMTSKAEIEIQSDSFNGLS